MPFRPGDYIACVGMLRQGKTLKAVELAYKYNRAGWPVVTNSEFHWSCWPNPDRCRRINTLSELFEVRSSIIVIDEIMDLLHNREYSSETSKLVVKEAVLWGKRGNIILYTIPSFRRVDISIRELTSTIYSARKFHLSTGRVTVYDRTWHGGDDTSFRFMSRSMVRHARYQHLYNTLDEQFHIVDDISPARARRTR